MFVDPLRGVYGPFLAASINARFAQKPARWGRFQSLVSPVTTASATSSTAGVGDGGLMPWRYGPFMALARGRFAQLPARWGRFPGILSFPAPPTYAAPSATSSGDTVDPVESDRMLLPWRFR